MDEAAWLARRFDEHRPHLRRVAYRMLGSAGESDLAVEAAWLRLTADPQSRDNLRGWLTTVVGGVCLETLQERNRDADQGRPAPIDEHADGDRRAAPDCVGLALFVVLESLRPAERVAVVLHDMFAVPYDEIAAIVGGTPARAHALVCRARERVRGTTR